MNDKPKAIVVGSGGFRGFMYLGALHRLYAESMLDEVRMYAGTSVGSILCYLLIIGYTPREIWKLSSDLQAKDLMKLSNNVIGNMGLSTTEKIAEFLNKLSKAKGFDNPTFDSLYTETKKVLFIPTFNITKKKEMCLNIYTTPQVPVIDAICMSCSVPIFCIPYKFEGNEYSDGALCNPYPVDHVDLGESVLGLYIEDNVKDGAIPDRLNLILTGSLDGIRNRSIEIASNQCRHIALDISTIDLTGLTITYERRLAIVTAGDAMVNLWLSEQYPEDHSKHYYLRKSEMNTDFIEESSVSGEESQSTEMSDSEYNTTYLD